MNRLTYSLACVALIGAAAPVLSAAHVDILAYNDNGVLDTGHVDVESDQVLTGTQLFTQTFDLVYPGLVGATAPGFYCYSDYPLLPSSDLGFNALAMTNPDTLVTSNLFYWDGDGAVDFAAPTVGSTLQFRLSSATNISVDGSASDVPGFVIDTTSPDGLLHKHISYAAHGPGGSDPADGLYLVSIQLTMPGLTDSEPVYFLFNADYQRDAQNNIIYAGDAPQVEQDSLDLAEAWIEQSFLTDALPGDLNGDGYVGLDDLQPILDHWNQTVTVGDASMGDIAGPGGTAPDGYVGLDDLQSVLDNWNSGTLPAQNAVAPEPRMLGLLGLGVMGLLKRRASSRC